MALYLCPECLQHREARSEEHAGKSRGKSAHSAIDVSCTVCHLAQTNGDMTTLSLLIPKPRICFACYEET